MGTELTSCLVRNGRKRRKRQSSRICSTRIDSLWYCFLYMRTVCRAIGCYFISRNVAIVFDPLLLDLLSLSLRAAFTLSFWPNPSLIPNLHSRTSRTCIPFLSKPLRPDSNFRDKPLDFCFLCPSLRLTRLFSLRRFPGNSSRINRLSFKGLIFAYPLRWHFLVVLPATSRSDTEAASISLSRHYVDDPLRRRSVRDSAGRLSP